MVHVTDYISTSGKSKHRHKIYGTPKPGGYADYVLMKKEFRGQDPDWIMKDAGKFKQLEFNTLFLQKMQKERGALICVYCGQDNLVIYHWTNKGKNTKDMATADHFYPKGQGGPAFDEDNLVVSCFKCNSKKKDKQIDLGSLKHLHEYGNTEIRFERLSQVGRVLKKI